MKALYLEDEVHRRVKLLAARRDVPLKEIVRSLLERALAEEQVGPDVTTAEWQLLAARGGSFDFLADHAEDIYSLAEGEPIE
jgi:plasmid stability protein